MWNLVYHASLYIIVLYNLCDDVYSYSPYVFTSSCAYRNKTYGQIDGDTLSDDVFSIPLRD